MRNYEVKWEDGALKGLSELDEATERKIKNQTEKALASDPFSNGKLLSGNWGNHWTYRIDYHGKYYRAVYEIIEIVYGIKKKKVIIAIVKVGGRTKTGQPDDVYMGEHPCSTLRGPRIIERPKTNIDKRAQQTKYSSETESSSSESEGEKLKKVNGSLSSLNLNLEKEQSLKQVKKQESYPRGEKTSSFSFSQNNESSSDSSFLLEIAAPAVLFVTLLFMKNSNFNYNFQR